MSHHTDRLDDAVIAELDRAHHRAGGLVDAGAIPRVIHQTFPTEDLPPALRDNVDALRMRNPGWRHQLYVDADIETFVADEYGTQVLAAYRRIAPEYGAARADLFRYLVVYRYGGVYLDIKSSADRPLDDVLGHHDSFIVSQWDNVAGGSNENWALHPELRDVPGGEFQQWLVIAAPGHPLLRAVIERVLRNIRDYNPYRVGVGLNVIRVTGPIPYTLAIAPLLAQYPHRRVRSETELGMRYTIMPFKAHHTHFSGHYSRRRTPIVGAPQGRFCNTLLLSFLVTRSLLRRAARMLGAGRR